MDVSSEVLKLSSNNPLLVAIDGVDGAGKTWFANELAKTLASSAERPIIRAGIDGFHNRRSIRYVRGQNSPEGFYDDSFNYLALIQELLDPLGPHGNRLYRSAVFDHRADAPMNLPQLHAAENSILVFDGIFLHRPELRDHWSLSVFLDVPFEIANERMVQRGDGKPDWQSLANTRYVEGQQIYFRECNPKALASIIIHNSVLEDPIALRRV